MKKLKKFKRIISVLISLSVMITAFSGLCVSAASEAYTLKADRVISEKNGTYTDRTDSLRFTRRNNIVYFVFSEPEILSMVTEKKFSVYSAGQTDTNLTYYTFNSSAPSDLTAADWNTYLANYASTGTLTASYDSTKEILSYDLSSVSVTDGQTVIFMLGSLSNNENIGSCNHADCPPQIGGTVDTSAVETAIVSKFNSATSTNIISLIKAYKNTVGFDMSLFDTLSESEIASYMLDKAGTYTTLASIKNVYDTIGILIRGVEKSISVDESYSEDSKLCFEFNKNPYASAMMMTEFRATLDGSLDNAQAVAKIGENEFTGTVTLDNDTLKVAFDFENLTDGCDITIEISGISGSLSSPVLWFKYDKTGFEDKALQAVNDASKENLKGVLDLYSKVFGIDMSALDGVYVLGVMEILSNISFSAISEISGEYVDAVELIKAKYTDKEITPDKTVTLDNKVLYVFDSAFEAKNAVDAVFSLTASENADVKYYSSDEALPESAWESWLTNGTASETTYENGVISAHIGSITGTNIVVETVSGTNAVLNFKYDKTTFETAILAEINNAAEADVVNIVLKYKKLFGIEGEIPVKADTSILNSELASATFTAFSEVKPAFEAAIAKAVAPKKIMCATKVMATPKNNYTTLTDVTSASTLKRYQVKVYYIFENIKYAGDMTDIVFKVAGADDTQNKKMEVYKISGSLPESTAMSAWEAAWTKVASNIGDSGDSPLTYKIPDISVSDGDTLILYLPNADDRSVGSGGNTSTPPQITFRHKIKFYDKSITFASEEITDYNNVPVVPKVNLKFLSVGKINTDTLKNSFTIAKSGGSETALTASVTETPYDNGDYYIYTVSLNVPFLDYNSNYSIKFNQNTVDEFGNGFADTSFDFKTEESSFTYSNGTVTANKNVKLLFGEPTYSNEILNSLSIDIKNMTASQTETGVSGIVFELTGTNPFEAKKADSSFAKVTDADTQRINKKIEINVGTENMPVLAAVLPMTNAVSNAGENDIISVTEADLEANAKLFMETTANASGVASVVWKVPNTTLSGDYVLYVKRNNGYSDIYYSFYYKNPVEQDSVLTTLSGAETTKTQFETALTSNEKLLGIDLTEYNALPQGKDIVISALYENRSNITSESVLKEMVDKEVLTQQINNITNAETLKTTLLANASEFGIGSSEIYTKIYGSQLATYGISENLVFTELASYNITKADDMSGLFDLAILKTALTNLANYRNSYDIVYSVNSTLGIDFTSYNSLGSNKDTALSKFVTAMASVTELSGVKTAFDTSVSTTPPGTTTVTPPAGGGGGGGGDWSGTNKELTVPNLNDDKVEEVPQVENKPIFGDVTASHWAYGFIDRLSSSGFVNGYGDGSFMPDSYITRAEFVSIVARAFGIDNSEDNCSFMDVDKESWCYPYIASAYTKGIISGINYDFFAPDRNISRQDAAVIIANMYKYLGADVNVSDVSFADKNAVSSYASDSVSYLAEKGVINGYTDGSFKPYNDITRAETCKIISQAIDIRWTVTE